MNGNEQIFPTIVSSAKEAYYGNAVVFGAVLARLSLFSEATLVFRSLTDKTTFGKNEVDGRRNTALRKFEKPWPNGTIGELLVRMIQDADLAGNAYIWDAGDQLVRLRPDWVTIISELTSDPLGRQYRKVVSYWYEPPQGVWWAGDPMMLLVDEVVHWAPNPDPEANFRGMSWLTPIIREVCADNAMTQYKIDYMNNAASPNLLIKYAQQIDQGVVNKIRDRVIDTHTGVGNAFKTLILDEGADVTVIGNTLEQINFSTVQAAGENRIIIASGVPGIVIGTKEGLMAATYSNYEQAMRRFADVTMRPLWRSACAALANIVNVPDGYQLWFDTNDIAALRQGDKERADTMLVLSQAAAALVEKGFEPKSVVAALDSGDFSILKFDKKPEPPTPPPTIQTGSPELNGTVKPEKVAA
jgi:phage portal protein BeeE